MRLTLVLLALVAGCDDDSNNATPDMTMVTAPDMTMVEPPDMTAPPDLFSPAVGRTYTGNLKPGQETPAVVSSATGSVMAVVNGTGDTVNVTMNFNLDGETFMVAHIHKAAAGVAGPPVKDLPAPTGNANNLMWKTSDATQPLTPALLNALDDG